jgi:hypothetical protein
VNSSFVFLWCIVRFKTSVKLYCSFSMVNFTRMCCSLNSAKVSSVCFLLVVNYENIIDVSKVTNFFLYFIKTGYICLRSICWIYVSANTADVGATMVNPSACLYYCWSNWN